MFPEWKTISEEWKDLLAAEVMKVKYQVENGHRRRVDWMARVTLLLEGEFSLYDFGLAKDDGTYGNLTLTHIHMVVIVVEHLGAEGLTYETVHELGEFLGQNMDILCDKKSLRRIQTVIRQVLGLCTLDSLTLLFSDQT